MRARATAYGEATELISVGTPGKNAKYLTFGDFLMNGAVARGGARRRARDGAVACASGVIGEARVVTMDARRRSIVYLFSRKSVTTVLISALRSERDMPNLVSRPWRTDFMETSSMLASLSMTLMASASSAAVGGWRAGSAAGAAGAG